MQTHNLMLDIPDVLAPCVLVINDISSYNFNDNNLCCPILEITPPGFSNAIVFNNNNNNNVSLSWNFSLSLTACDLGLQTENCNSELCSLTDGIYVIRYSVSPNNVVYVEYNHLRITNIMLKYRQTLCCIDTNRKRIGYDDIKLMNMLSDFRIYLDGAKALVENCHHPKEGMQLYNMAMNILDKINCNYC